MEQQSYSEDVAILKLAPFTPKTKIIFENISVGVTSVKKLIIQNPSLSKNKLTISRIRLACRNFVLSWHESVVEPQKDIVLELSWTPTEEGSWKEILRIIDGKNLKRDVSIIFKSILKTGQKRVVKKQIKLKPTVVAEPTTNKINSPKNNKNVKIIEKCSMPKILLSNMDSNKENSSIICQNKSSNGSSKSNQQTPDHLIIRQLLFSEKINHLDDPSFSSSQNINFKCDNIPHTPIRRATYEINESPLNDLLNISDQFNDSLEVEKKLNNLDITSEVKFVQKSFVKELNIESSEVEFSKNSESESDNILVQKLMLDSFNFTAVTTEDKQSNFVFLLNNLEVDNEVFLPNNCSIETKLSVNDNENNPSTSKELFKFNNTYEHTPKVQNMSTEKFVNNLNGETYSVINLSTSSSYNLLSPEQSDIYTSSPIYRQNSLNYVNFREVITKTELSCITEEQSPKSKVSIAGIKRPSEMVFSVSPPKRPFINPKTPKARKSVDSSWNKKLEKTEKIRRKSLSNLKQNSNNCSMRSNTSLSSINISQSSCNIDPFLIAIVHNSNTSLLNLHLDPFISSSLYYDETWLEKQAKELKKWLNALLIPPSDLDTKAESRKVDVAKLWQDCVKKDLIYVPTKENVSSKYHTSYRLEILRKSAKNLFHCFEIRSVLSKIALTIENKLISIREDKNLHLDVGLQSQVLNLLLCYNPLWLRIGLETVYNESIQLESNSDVIGLSTFIMVRFFRCPDLIPKNKQAAHLKYLPNYGAAFKKCMLKKFLMLVYFLDQAKTKKIIFHDPCLFCKDAPIKESKELLLSFSRELLSAVGDLTRFLRRLGYEVSHKQNNIDEFDYAVKNLDIDLKDGIRLARVMEIILSRNDLTNQLRSPAISRLQKIYNVKLSFESLNQAGYNIAGYITPKDIVDGHPEKTLSFLWQIIYKFQAPRFTSAAIKIQIWWRSLSIVIKRKILDYPRQKRIIATIKIQQFYRSWKLMQQHRAQFLHIKNSVIIIQRFIRITILMRQNRRQFLVKKQAAVIIQRYYRAQMLMNEERKSYFKLKNAAILIQRRFRSKLHVKKTRNYYISLKKIVVNIQRNFRAKKVVQADRNMFLKKRIAAIIIQKHFRAQQLMKMVQNNYIRTRETIIKVQRRFKATIFMRKDRENYLQYRSAIIIIQQRFRAYLVMKTTRKNYLKIKRACICLQQHFRAYVAMKMERKKYLQITRTVIFLQDRFRTNVSVKKERDMQQNKAAIIIQQYFKSYLTTKLERENYILLRKNVMIIQNHFRANLMMKQIRKIYNKKKLTAITIQRWFRNILVGKKHRKHYLLQKKSACVIQQRFREYLLMKHQRNTFLKMKKSSIIIQNYFRSYLLIKKFRQNFFKNKELAIQTEFKERQKLHLAATKIQALWRAYKFRKGMSKKLVQIRQRSISITKNALPEQRIGKRNLEAIHILMYQTTTKEIIRALTILDFSTRLFPYLCIEICSEMTERLYVLLVCTNRSVPDMDISILCFSVLINLFKYPPTCAAVWKTEYLERLLLLLLHWSNKNGNLFIYACTLLWLFTQNSDYCKIMKQEKNVTKILVKTFQQCERKQKMSTRMRNAPTTVHFQKNVLPSVKPDWGISNANHPRLFQNPIFAIKCLLKKLNVEL